MKRQVELKIIKKKNEDKKINSTRANKNEERSNYRRENIALVEPKIVTGKELLDAMEVPLELSALSQWVFDALPFAFVLVILRLVSQIPLVFGQPLRLCIYKQHKTNAYNY